MKTTLKITGEGRNLQIATPNHFIISLGLGGGHYCDNNSLRYDAECEPTTTMEVAIMYAETHSSYNPEEGFKCDFVCLPDDVAGYVPCSQLAPLIEAVEAHDWERVCMLCDHQAVEEAFPNRHQSTPVQQTLFPDLEA